MILIIKLFIVAFFINLLYEMLHSLLYKTCHEASLQEYVYLMLKGAFFDGFAIASAFFIFYLILPEHWIIPAFSLVMVFLSYVWEYHAITHKRWEYTKHMPIVAGVGITPLIQLFLTGILSLHIVIK